MRLTSQVAALCVAAMTAPACARPFTTQDLLAAEEFGQAAFTPDGKLLVFERLIAFEDAGPFEYDAYPPLRRGRIYVQEVGSAAPPRQLLEVGSGEGHTAGPISPSGKSMVVLRLKGRDWEAGVVTLASGQVRWLGITPELAQLGRTIAWRSEDQLVIAARSSIPLRLRAGWQAHETLQAFWEAAAAGRPAISQVHSEQAFVGGASLEPEGRLLLVDLARGQTRTLANLDAYDLEVSPDGRKVAAMAQYEALAPTPAPRVVATPNRRRNLIIADLATGAIAVPCPACDLDPHLLAWSPSSREVLVHGRRTRQARPELLRLSERSAASVPTAGRELALRRTSEGHIIPPAAWLAGAPIALLRTNPERSDWHHLTGARADNLSGDLPAQPSPKLLANDGRSAFVASAGAVWRIGPGGPLKLGAGAPTGAQGLSLSSRERQNLAPMEGWYAPAAGDQLVAFTTGESGPASAPAGAAPLAISRRASASVRTTAAGALELVLADPAPRVVMGLNTRFDDIDFANVHAIPAGGGLSHHLLLPPRPSAQPPPLIVIPYPGLDAYPAPRAYGGGNGRFPSNAELMAAAGYAVLIPALPRRAGLEPSEKLADQILAAVDLATQQVGGFDGRRPILWGQSFGGYASLMAASQSDRFSAVVASAAPTNLSSARGVFDPHGEARPQDGLSAYMLGWSEGGQANLQASPWEAPGLYVRNSPVFQAGRISAPVLLIHGDTDFVRLGQAQEMFSALARQAKDVTLITAYGEGHVISTPGNLNEVYARAFRWLARRAGPPPDP